MSFILDALRKSEHDRQREKGPGLAEVAVAPPKPKKNVWASIAVALLVVNLVAIGVLLIRRGGKTESQAAVPATAAPASAATAPPTNTASVAAGLRRPHRPRHRHRRRLRLRPTALIRARFRARSRRCCSPRCPRTRTAARAIRSRLSSPTPTPQRLATTRATTMVPGTRRAATRTRRRAVPRRSAGRSSTRPCPRRTRSRARQCGGGGSSARRSRNGVSAAAIPAAAVSAATVPAVEVPGPRLSLRAAPVPGGVTPQVSEAPSSTLPNAEDIASQSGLPDLHLDVHVYSTKPSERFAFINSRKYKEGDTLQEGPHIDRITPDAVELSYHGNRFQLSRQ